MSKTSNIVIFALGAAIGSLATWRYFKDKYEKIAKEDFDSKRKHSSDNESDNEPTSKANISKKADVKEYDSILSKSGYTNYSDSSKEEAKSTAKSVKPYVIPPEEFGEDEEYDQISITYYADQVLADDADKIIENVEDIVGFESLTHFGEYEDDSVVVKNDRLKCYFEILLDQRRYLDVIAESPYKAE